jgi:spermidine synthase
MRGMTSCGNLPNRDSYRSLAYGFLSLVTQNTVFEEPARKVSDEQCTEMKLRYYDSGVHRTAFTLPRFAKKVLQFAVTLSSCYKFSSLQALSC